MQAKRAGRVAALAQHDRPVADARRQPRLVPDAPADRLLLVEQRCGPVEVAGADEQQGLLADGPLEAGVVADGTAGVGQLLPLRWRRRAAAGVQQLDRQRERLVARRRLPGPTGEPSGVA